MSPGLARSRETGGFERGARRAAKKHGLALILASTVLFFLFVPPAFFGRVLSPNDVYYIHDPWRTVREVIVQNPLMSDPPSSWMTLWSLVRDDPAAFHWNRYIAGGIPGYGSAASAVLSPVVLVPIAILPLVLSYSGIIAAKLLTSFLLAYGWLREERLGKRGAAIGALIFSSCGIYSVWWLWQSTNATVFYPAVFWIIARAFAGKRTPFPLLAGTGLAMALSGYPVAVAYCGWAGAFYVIYLSVRERRFPWRAGMQAAAAVALSLAIAAPFLAPFVSFLQRSGYLETRAGLASTAAGGYPLHHFAAFLDPYRLGNPAERLWIGDPALRVSNNLVEATVYLGLGSLLLVAFGLFRRHRSKAFWIALTLVLLLLIFVPGTRFGAAVGSLPGFEHTFLVRIRFLLPLAAAFLAGLGVRSLSSLPGSVRARHAITAAIGLWIALDLAFFAVKFFPYLTPDVARIPITPTVELLRQEGGPARVAPFFDFLWPNSAELMRVEDIRSHFGSEARWRALLSRFAPGSFGGTGTVILFNSLNFDFSDPLLSALNVRWLVEQPSIDIVSWRVVEASSLAEPIAGTLHLWPGLELRRQIAVTEGMKAIDLNFGEVRAVERGAAIQLEIIRPETGERLWARRLTPEEARTYRKVHVPIVPWGAEGNVLLLRIRSAGVHATAPRAAGGELAYGTVKSPIVLHSILPEGRVYENLDVRQRFWPVWKTVRLPFEAMLADRSIDLRMIAVLTGEASPDLGAIEGVGAANRRAELRVSKWTGALTVVESRSEVPFLLASSEKITPELEIRMDGAKVDPIEMNGMFASIPVDAGSHTIELRRRVGRGWWPVASGGLLLAVAISLLERRQLRGWTVSAPRK